MSILKVGVLLTVLTGLLVWLGHAFGGTSGMVIAFGLALVMNFGSYWFSDKIVLAMTKAQPVDPAQAPELYAMVQRLAERAEIPMPRLFIVPDPSPNAFATGRSPKFGVVAVNQGLLNILDKPEVEGVIAHEISHIKHRDTLTMAIVATLAGAITLIANMIRWGAIFGGVGGNNERNPIGLLAMSLVAPLAAILIQMGISRNREFAADAEAARMVGSGRGLQGALLKLDRGTRAIPGHMPENAAHMCIVNPFAGLGGFKALFSTHPPMEDRVRRLEDLESQLRRA
ncbi:MAG: zinc metalloprotease HtpX [Fimbriimonadaceae bacterium]|nr:zinc metalloprotease HtpX [Fimbriimonadaceae bacterium]QYK55599.1 MAG: zinc metalloprotease HtpX [Fimbriimonadaceae bacterium]